ncbi:MAG: FkbM family methyltransferase [Hyphomicrobiales bacterium]
MNKFEEQFLDFFAHNAQSCYSQFGQDIWALWVLNGLHDGYFVEFGATDGHDTNNSFLLEATGWSGIVAEPSPMFHTSLQANRNCHVSTECIWTESNQQIEFCFLPETPARSHINAPQLKTESDSNQETKTATFFQVPTIRLNDLLDRHDAPRVIDFISIDTEGSEFDILSDFDFSNHQFRTIAVEHNFSESREKIAALLEPLGYTRLFSNLSHVDDWYVDEETLAKLKTRVEGSDRVPLYRVPTVPPKTLPPVPLTSLASLHFAKLLKSHKIHDSEELTQRLIDTLISQAVIIAPNIPKPLIAKATNEIDKQNHLGAIQIYSDALQQYDSAHRGNFKAIYMRLGNLLMHQRNFESAANTFQLGLDYFPNDEHLTHGLKKATERHDRKR